MKNKAKNDNLLKYKELLQQRNKALIERAIAHIKLLQGNVTMSMVAKVTYEIADAQKKEKGITLAGISKNLTYRALVEHAQADGELKNGLHNRGKTRHLSDGDIRMSLHAQRVENNELKRTNKILIQQLREVPNVIETTEPIADALIKEHNLIRNVARTMTNRMCELELAYIDANTKTLRVMHYEDVIIPSEALELFYMKELDDIQRKIREHASDD